MALALLAVVLCIVGLRTLVAGSPEAAKSTKAERSRDLAVEAFAEAFTRAYLTWDSGRPEAHQRRTAAFTSQLLEPGAGLSLPRHGAQAVTWTAVMRDEAVARGRRLVTVAAETTRAPYYVSVAVQRDRRGLMAIADYPALVGAPPVDTNASRSDGTEVEDRQLQVVVRRAIVNYLRGERTDLLADLDSSATLALPETPLRPLSIDSVTLRGPRTVAVELRAEGRGVVWTLRYEIEVIKRERWYVRSIQGRPASRRPL